MKQDLTKIYDGADLLGSVNGVIYLPIVRALTLEKASVRSDLDQSGDAVFEVRKNNVVIAGLGALTIPNAAKIGTIVGLNIALVDGDEITLNLLSGSVSAPVTLNLGVDDGIGGGAAPSQSGTNFSTAVLGAGGVAPADVAVGKVSHCWRVQSTVPARIRAYSTAAYRTADAARPVETLAVGETGLLLEAVTSDGNLTLDAAQAALLFNGDIPPLNIIYFAVQNLSGAPNGVTVTLTKLILEV